MNPLFRLTPGLRIALGSSFLTMQTSAASRWKALGYSVSHQHTHVFWVFSSVLHSSVQAQKTFWKSGLSQ